TVSYEVFLQAARSDENKLRLDQRELASRFRSRGNRRPPALHHSGWLGGTVWMRCLDLLQKSSGSRTFGAGTRMVGELRQIQVQPDFRPLHPSKDRRARTATSHIWRRERKLADHRIGTAPQVWNRFRSRLFRGTLY